MTTATNPDLTTGSGRDGGFLERHPADAIFFPAFIGVIWLLMLAGFVPELIQRTLTDPPPYPPIIHVHAVIYFGWLVFLAMQTGFIRLHRVQWHRRMGVFGLFLALAVIVVGPAAGLTMQMAGQARQPPHFLAIQLASVTTFALMVGAGLLLRRRAAAHKRLMLIGTLGLIGAGFGRVIRMLTGSPPPFTLIPSVFIAAAVLMLVLAIYDLSTRGRLHPVFLPAAATMLSIQLTAGLLLRWPVWIDFTRELVS